ncbi:MAG TPA: ATP-binding protein [Anaerolineae bacterium]|nr:ATP-binding protein [Anaerolineae bacterium]
MLKLRQVAIFSQENEALQILSAALPKECVAQPITTLADLTPLLENHRTDFLVLMLPRGQEIAILEQIESEVINFPLLLITCGRADPALFDALLAVQPLALLTFPFTVPEAQTALTLAFERGKRVARYQHLSENLAEVNRNLNQRLQELNTIYTIGRSVTASLDATEVMTRVVAMAVNLTQADEGLLLLREADKLYLRISRQTENDVTRSFHQEVSDPSAGQVIRSGRPTMLHRPTQVATGTEVRALLYVPLQAPGRGVIGVLGVLNVARDQAFTEQHLFALSSIADFAGIALENARLFGAAEMERSRLSAILEHAAEPILVTDDANRLLLWSHTAAEVFGIRPDARGQELAAHITHEGLCDLFNQADLGDPLLHDEIRLEDGRVFNAQLSVIADVGRVAIMQNITHLKELDRLKSEFVSTVSHDLRTPLTTILGYMELLERVGPLSDMQQNFIAKALNSLTHITALIGDLLDIGRIEAGYDLEMHPIRLDEVIARTADAYTLYAEQHEIALRVDLGTKPLWVRGNARRMRQVIENLTSNAIKYNRSGGWVEITAQLDGDHIIVRIEDNGIGIPFEEQPKLFERFYRVKTAETADIQGTGLGLAIVKSVIEKHQGRVWVESLPGAGSAFVFIVPNCAVSEAQG